MKRLDIKITFQCNNRCRFCVQGEKRHNSGSDLPQKKIFSILRKFRNSYDEVVFTGGEATIRKDILELVSFAKGLDYRVHIQSNGRMFFYKDFCTAMVEAGMDQASISVHGHNAKLHDYLTYAKGSFTQTTSGIKNLISLGKIVTTNTVINKHNYRYLPAIARKVIELGVLQYQFAFPHIMGSAFVNFREMIPKKSIIMPYVRKGLKIGLEKNRLPMTEAIPYCFLKGCEKCVSDRIVPDSKVFDVYVTESFNAWRKDEGKSKGPACVKCKYYECCEGPWKEYPQLFGWSEFIPVKS